MADVGCGHGASTLLIAAAYPNSIFHGFDYHELSIARARLLADRSGVADRVTFEVADAKEYPGTEYDFVAFFDSLHDMGDPVGTAAHVRASLKPTGVWMIVEPFAHDNVEANFNPVGRIPDGDGFDPASRRAIGHWLCRGWFMSYTERVHPHVVTTQEYVLGIISEDHPSPEDTLASSGVEGAVTLAHRAVIGGSGRYRHARGDVRQLTIGTNTTELLPGVFAPNFRFFFRL